MAELDLKAIQARVDAATPGPWSADPTGTVCADADLLDSSDGPTLPANGPMEVAECYRSESPQERAKNAEFVAHARSDVPALLAEVRGLRDAVKLLGQHNQDDYDLALIRIAELEGQVEDLTGQVAGRDETIQRVERDHRRLLARLRDVVSGLRIRDDELLAIRDRTSDHEKALGHEWTAHEVRQIAIRLNALVESFDGDPADDGSAS